MTLAAPRLMLRTMLIFEKKLVPATVVLLFASVAQLEGQTENLPLTREPYLGQDLPGLTPVVFAPGVVSSTDHRELGGVAVSPDGREVFFTRSIGNRWVLLVSRLEDRGWTLPEPFEASRGFGALEPHVSLDGGHIYWVWRGAEEEGMFRARRTEDGWSEAEYVGPGMMVSSARDGRMFVTDIRERPFRIVEVELENGRFTKYVPLEGNIRQFQEENRTAHPCVSPDGTILIFDSNGTHLFVSFRDTDGAWGAPVDLTRHGFSPNAGIATISPDGDYLFFGQGNDIYWVSMRVLEPLRLGRRE